ncbi:AAA family ATPase [Streptosporangium sp. NPDC023825]|uniref:ATP-binding protein n=1 Tax=Streptosporangium sp. NPDC023825 TaxID=3154909 RepID=UPI0034486FD6
MARPDPDDHLRRQLRTLQRVVGGPTDATLARRSGVAAATFSEVMAGKRRLRDEFVAKVVAGCVACARATGRVALDERHVLQALRLPGHTAADNGIFERDDDLNSCSSSLDDVRRRAGATIVVEGPAGIGKSELLARVCSESAVRGITPLVVRGNQLDQTMAFCGVRTLLGRWAAGHSGQDRQRLFAGAAAFARVPLGLPHTRRGGSMIGLTEALYWLLVNATDPAGRDDALLLAVDDAHWLDEESLNWLEFLSDRLAGLPVVLLLACRPDEPTTSPALTRIILRATSIIRPRPLSLDAVRAIVDRSLGRRSGPPDETFCSAFHQHSGGNPFYLRWMLDLAHERRLAPTAGSATRVARLIPRQVVVHLNERLSMLGPSAGRLARTIAVLGPGIQLDQAVRLAGLTSEEGGREYDRLCRAAILADRSSVDFRHPIIRSAVYDALDPSQRSDTHLAAARLLHHADAGLETVAAHLLRVNTAGDPWVVDRLAAAAAEAMSSGLAGTAARYLGRAVAEPPPPGRRCQVRMRYGQALALGEVATAIPELLAARKQAADDAQGVEAAIALAKAYSYANRLGDAVRSLDRALDGCRDDALRDRLRAEQLLWATWWADDPHRPDRMLLLDRAAPPLSGTGHVERLLIATHAWSLVLRGEPRTAAAEAIRPVLRNGVSFADLDQGMEVGTMTGFVHLYSDDLSMAGRLFEQAMEEFDRNGWRGTHLTFTRAHVANVALREGRLADAVADAEIALRLADRTGPGTPGEQFATGTLIEALLARGDVERAQAVCGDREYGTSLADAVVLPVPNAVRGALQLARGQTAGAAATLRRVGQWLENACLLNPSMCLWRFDLGRALRHSAPDQAREVVAVGMRRADRFGGELARARALRTLAVLQPDSAVELLEEAIRILCPTPHRLEQAHALAELGTALTRSDHDARVLLSEALTLAEECGAVSLGDAVARRLGSAPRLRRRRVNALDPCRQRVARLAADGHSKSEIAYSMVLDLDTVTTLLREAHDVLGVDSLAGLRRALTP